MKVLKLLVSFIPISSARLFLEFWKREQSSKAFEWDTLGFEGQDEPPRPQYEQKATSTVVNAVTMKTEPSIPNTARYPRLASAFMVSLFMVSEGDNNVRRWRSG